MPLEPFILGAGVLAVALIAIVTFKLQKERVRTEAAAEARKETRNPAIEQGDSLPNTTAEIAEDGARRRRPLSNAVAEEARAVSTGLRGSVSSSDGAPAGSTKYGLHRVLLAQFFDMLRDRRRVSKHEEPPAPSDRASVTAQPHSKASNDPGVLD